LNGETDRVRKRKKSAIIAVDVRRFGRAINTDEVFGTHRYKSVLDLAGMKLPCAIIQGPNGIQRVLSENGITNAILGSRSGASKRLKKAASEFGGPLCRFLWLLGN
jgi:hypothetical protein